MLVFAVPAYAEAQEAVQPMQEIYSRYEPLLKAQIDEEVSFLMSVPAQNGASEGEQRKLLTDFVTKQNYQRLIDRMYCWEKANEATAQPTCIEDRDLNSKSMLKFYFDYPDLSYTFSVCEIKSRMVEYELKYPPYGYMKTAKSPKAYDAGMFLQCVRSKL